MGKVVVVESFVDLIAALDMHPAGIYRGVSDYRAHIPIPSVGRGAEDSYSIAHERRIFRLFKEKSLPYLSYRPKDDWEYLALAQHYGLPTRLMDWTWNPLIAAFFAVTGSLDSDGAMYNLYAVIVGNYDSEVSPFESSICLYNPPHFDQRIAAQSGVFTCHDRPTDDQVSEESEIIVIPQEIKSEIRHNLRILGVHYGSIFPGLEGIAKAIKTNPECN